MELLAVLAAAITFAHILYSFALAADSIRSIRNPVLPGFDPDPSFLRVGDDYYIATSTFEWFPGVRIHHSRDLIHWRLLTCALTRTSQLDLRGAPPSGGVWAPCLSHCDGLFYLVYTNVNNRSGGFVDARNYLTTAEDVTGPWSEPVYLNSIGFDPSLFHDDDGRKWLLNMVWDHRLPTKSGGIVLQEYDPKGKALIGTSKLIFRGTELEGTEAAHIYKHGGFYHLMTAEGGTWYGHAVTMARSEKIDGPYELDPRNPILTSKADPGLPLQKAGHGSLVQTQDGSWYMAHLCARPLPETGLCNLGRETALQKCRWSREGWLMLEGGGNEPRSKIPAPDLPEHPFPKDPARDEFDGPELNIHFNTLREPPDPAWFSLTERPGYLRMRGRESLSSRFRTSIAARRMRAFRCEASTRLEFEPENFKQMAGLVCIYNDKNFIYLRISHDENMGRNVAVMSLDKGKMAISKPEPLNSVDPCFLKVAFDYKDLRFFHSTDGKTWEPVGPTYDAGKLSDDYCRGFTGTMIGVAVQDMTGAMKHGDFDFFEYRELE